MTHIAILSDPDRAKELCRTPRPSLEDDRRKTWRAHAVALLGIEEGGRLLAVLGYRITFGLCWGKSLYVDDLVVAPDLRLGGYGRALLYAAKAIARGEHCDHTSLCSGLTRVAACRFFKTSGLSGFSKQFVLPLKGF